MEDENHETKRDQMEDESYDLHDSLSEPSLGDHPSLSHQTSGHSADSVVVVKGSGPSDSGSKIKHGSRKRLRGKNKFKKRDKSTEGNKNVSIDGRSEVWNHFKKIRDEQGQILLVEGREKATCNYCGKEYGCTTKNGTNTMLTHINIKCLACPFSERNKSSSNLKQSTLAFKPVSGVEGQAKLVNVTFSVDACRKALAEMVIIDELAFRFVEGEGFRRFISVVQPRWLKIPCRITVAKDCMRLYCEEKNALRKMLKSQRVSFTTDCWTSLQNLNYMCLTAHFIDSKWKLNKKILNFCLVPNHKGETLGKVVEQCLIEWGIDKVLTVTVDNAKSNDGLIDFLRRKTKSRKTTILEHKYLHVRCCAHILNLIVEQGLKEVDESIIRVRNVVKYVRSSPSRMITFKSCDEKEGIESKLQPILDVPTRWNSTFLMLERAVPYQKAFDRLEDEDKHFNLNLREDELKNDFDPIDGIDLDSGGLGGSVQDNPRGKGKGKGKKVHGPPNSDDWKIAGMYLDYLRTFYHSTLRFSGSLHVTCNNFFAELILIQVQLADSILNNEDEILFLLAKGMKSKFDKYWGQLGLLNPLLLYGVILDPRFKLKYVKFCLEKCNEPPVSAKLENDVLNGMKTLFNWYEECNLRKNGPTHNVGESSKEGDGLDSNSKRCNDLRQNLISGFKIHMEEENNLVSKSELERYLLEGCEQFDENHTFDLLTWWKANSLKYPIVSQMARDVLAIPMTTVASESAFSTGGRILDPFRTSLAPKMVEALICTQNWIKTPKKISLRDHMDEVEHFEQALGEDDLAAFREDP